MVFSSTSNNTVTGNTVNSNLFGIALESSSSNNVLNNSASLNGDEITLSAASNNNVTGNTVSGSSNTGIVLNTGATGANNNIIYRNNFIGNTTQAYVPAGSGNLFNLPLPTGGNYWSNWTTPDSDNDGIVDSPYVFSGGQDNYPWTLKNGWLGDYFWTWYDNLSPGAKDWCYCQTRPAPATSPFP